MIWAHWQFVDKSTAQCYGEVQSVEGLALFIHARAFFTGYVVGRDQRPCGCRVLRQGYSASSDVAVCELPFGGFWWCGRHALGYSQGTVLFKV